VFVHLNRLIWVSAKLCVLVAGCQCFTMRMLLAEDFTLGMGDGVIMDFVWIPLAGDDGAATVEIGDFSGAHGTEPIKSVTVAGPFARGDQKFGFYLGKTEVTEEQWAVIMNGDAKSKKPVADKTYAEIGSFIEALNSKSGQSDGFPATPDGKRKGEIRLPTEAEWEYAARGGASAENYKANDPYQGDVERFEVISSQTGGVAREVAKLPPNSLGLHDMLGNVREFVEGRYLEESGGGRLLKGGCFTSEKSEIRSSARTEQSTKAPFAGFRLCISADFHTVFGPRKSIPVGHPPPHLPKPGPIGGSDDKLIERVRIIVADSDRYFRSQEFERSLAGINDADKLVPNNPGILLRRARIYESLKQADKAAADYAFVSSIPGLPEPLRSQAQKKCKQLGGGIP